MPSCIFCVPFHQAASFCPIDDSISEKQRKFFSKIQELHNIRLNIPKNSLWIFLHESCSSFRERCQSDFFPEKIHNKRISFFAKTTTCTLFLPLFTTIIESTACTTHLARFLQTPLNICINHRKSCFLTKSVVITASHIFKNNVTRVANSV